MVAEAPEQERTEAWIMEEVNRGVGLQSLYPTNADTRLRYEAAKLEKPVERAR